MLNGIPTPVTPPEYNVSTFKLYIPKLKWWVEDGANTDLYNLAVKTMKQRLNYSYWLEDWEEAMSLAVAHFIITTDPRFAQSTDSDTTAGGVMKSRSVAEISYNYDIEYYLDDNPAYKYWNTTGYGRRLCSLSQARGWIGVITG